MKPTRAALLLTLAALMALFAGCARERTGPFDIPSAAPMAATGGVAAGDDAAALAALEIAASAIFFDFDKSVIRPDAHVALDRVAALLRRFPCIGINIEGHCDERGSREFNFGLGERRARAAFAQLTARGVDPAQVYMVTYGKDAPAVPGITERDHARNRRVEFVVVTTCR